MLSVSTPPPSNQQSSLRKTSVIRYGDDVDVDDDYDDDDDDVDNEL